VANACRRAGRDPGEVTLVAVCKGQPPEAIRAAVQAGHRCFGENYAQELEQKAANLGAGLCWHFIGGLQRNKAGKVVGRAALIQTVDRESLAAEIDRRAAMMDIVQDVLVQVNVGSEPQKSGVAPADLPALLEAVGRLEHLRCRGVMAIPPFEEDPRPHFRALRDIAREHGLPELSMGMSDDFEEAIEEEATIVRVGTAIFGPRDYR